MNIYQKALEQLMEALEPLVLAGQGKYMADALVRAMELPSGTIVGELVSGADFDAIAAFLEVADPQLEDFLDIAPHIVAVTQKVNNLATTANVSDVGAAVERGLSAVTILWLKNHQPYVYALLRMLQIIEARFTDHWTERLHFDRIGTFVTDAHGYLRTHLPLQTEQDAQNTSNKVFKPLAAAAAELQNSVKDWPVKPILPFYGWDSPADPNAPIAEKVATRALAFGIAAHDSSTNADASLLAALAFIPAEDTGPGLMLSFAGAKLTIPIGDDWTLAASLGSGNELTLAWIFGDRVEVRGNAGTSITVEVGRKTNKPLVLPILGNTRIELGDVDFHFAANGREIDTNVTIHDAALIIDKGSSDSFSGSKMPANGVRGDFDLVLGLSSTRGVYLGGTAGISATIPLNKDIGPLHLDTLRIEVRPDDATNAIRVSAGLSMSLEVGPVVAVVDGIGIRLDVTFPATGANLGVVDVQPKFQWPRGIGVKIDAGVVTGGGYIYFDPDNGRYAGVLQLEMKSFSLKAIGLLDTKLPGGQKGFSFLIIISAEFSPISLVMGFTLNGVGGLAGLHRTIAIAPMQEGVRNHAVDDILFPDDPIKNAPRIISDLQRFFPPEKGRYIFGPMVLIGWGSPTLLTIELGIILELPAPLRIVLLGQLNCTLPTKASPLIELHVDILGVLDFGAKLFALDGVIHDSKIGPFSIFGDFAVRLRWGAQSAFALSVGGFHPRFPAPAGFPALRRITLALSDSDNPRLTMQCYFAITSNSLQFGSRAELYASAGKFNISGWIGFDVLLIFNPFSLRADLSAGFTLRRGSKVLAGLWVEATLTGPGPWHVWGSASISILCFDVSVDFELTIGSAISQPLPPTSIWPSLKPAIEREESWSAVMPPAAARVVTVMKPDGATVPLLDPVGRITMTERVAPLNRVNTKFAEGVPSAPLRFQLDSVVVMTMGFTNQQVPQFFLNFTVVYELFPPAQVEQMSDDEKLSRPSFEKMAAGMSLPDLITMGDAVSTGFAYRTVVIDDPVESHNGKNYELSSGVLDALSHAGAAASGGVKNSGSDQYVTNAPPLVVLADETYVVASADDLKKRLDVSQPASKSDVVASLADYISKHPEDRGKLVIVPEEEAA